MQLLSDLNDGEHMVWAYCKEAFVCGHHVKLDLTRIIEEYGDMASLDLRPRLKCSKCGSRATVSISHSGRPPKRRT